MSNITTQLQAFRQKFEPVFLAVLKNEEKTFQKIDGKSRLLFDEIKRIFLSGGKRIRPAQLYFSYLACGGNQPDRALQAAAALEMLHTFAIIHDDIIDQSDQRRGQPTSHKYFEQVHQQEKLMGDRRHFSLSSAILVGDLSLTLADKILTDSPFPPNLILKAKKLFDAERLGLVAGEFLDVYGEYLNTSVEEKFILTILEFKTGTYTCGYPLQIGALLAGANLTIQKSLFDAGIKAGIAFQIQDDILGTFGQEVEVGKSVDSDLLEGKKTLLVVKALELAAAVDKIPLKKFVGNKSASAKDIDRVRNIIKKSGSLDYSVNLAQKLIRESKKELGFLPLKNEGKEFLLGLVEFLLQRKF